MQEFIQASIGQSLELKALILSDRAFISRVARVAGAAVKALRAGGKIMLAGNGGSAADAQHLAAEFVNRFRFDRPALPALALSVNTSVLTSIANDSAYDNIFARQVEALGAKGDLFIGISTSGTSPNILKALKACRPKRIITVGLTGQNRRKMEKLCDYCLAVPSADTPRVQEAHIMLGHIICDIIEKILFVRKR